VFIFGINFNEQKLVKVRRIARRSSFLVPAHLPFS
jgi:hypothetical protein